jgi:RNase P protein component
MVLVIKEALLDQVAQIEVAGLNEDGVVLVIKRFKTTLKAISTTPNKHKSRGKHSCFKCSKSVFLLFNAPIIRMTRTKTREGRRIKRSSIRRRVRHILARSGIQTALHPTLRMKDWQLQQVIPLPQQVTHMPHD